MNERMNDAYEQARVDEVLARADQGLTSSAAIDFVRLAQEDEHFCLKYVPHYLYAIDNFEDAGEITMYESILLTSIMHAAAYKKDVLAQVLDLNKRLVDVMDAFNEPDNVEEFPVMDEEDDEFDEAVNA